MKPLTVRWPFKNVHHLGIDHGILGLHNNYRGLPYLRLLEALPNLVSLSLNISGYCAPVELPRVVLQSLKSLTLETCCKGMMISILKFLHVPSLEHLALDVT